MRKTSALVVAIATIGGFAAALPATASAAVGPAAIPQSHPSWATPQSKVGTVAAGSTVNFRVYLKTRNADQANALALAVSDPTNAVYHQYLTPDQVRAQFAPTQATVDSVRSWLAGAGFHVGSVPTNNAYVEASGTVAQADQAFNVQLANFSVKGRTLRAADKDLSVPAALSGSVLGVVGVDQAESLIRPDIESADTPDTPGAVSAPANAGSQPADDVPPPAGFRNARPCSDYFGQKIDTTDPKFNGQFLPYATCGYTPAQIRGAYGLDRAAELGVSGRGQTVAIIDAFASPNLFADAHEYARRNDPAHPLRAGQFREEVDPPTVSQEPADQCDASGWFSEQALDVETVHAVAPNANILYKGSADCQDASLDKSLNDIVAAHSASIISNSWGSAGEDLPADDIAAFHTTFTQAAMEGIGIYFSSGDAGDEAAAVGRPEPDYPASDPLVTAVGGTSVGIDRHNRVSVETGWETGKGLLDGNGGWKAPAWTSGAGGGTSRQFAEPNYQRHVVPDALAKENQTGDARGRVVPDISADADPNTGFLVGLTQTFPEGAHYDQFRLGGTSLAAPLISGIMADSDQFTGFHHGFANPLLYHVTAHTPGIRDVRPETAAVARVDFVDQVDDKQGLIDSVRIFNDPDQTIHTTRGYDNVTGIGSPNGILFLALS